jgi:hypothetical protein
LWEKHLPLWVVNTYESGLDVIFTGAEAQIFSTLDAALKRRSSTTKVKSVQQEIPRPAGENAGASG